MKVPPFVVAVGYSVRSLVEACSRAELHCVAVDHFGDADTRAYAEGRWIKLDLIDDRLIAAETLAAIEKTVSELREGQSVAFLLAGGMESLGEAVEQLRCLGTVVGPSETQRTKLRDWRFLESAAIAAGIEFPKTLSENDSEGLRESVESKNWLWKPSRGAGGLKIARAENAEQLCGEGYWQQLVQGRQLGVTCLLQAESCTIVGATRSLDANDWPGPREFIYRGSIGPVQLSIQAQQQLNDLCVYIRRQLGCAGLLQFDFMQTDGDQLWLLECNPRWTAGTEVLLGFAENGKRTRNLIFDGILNGGVYLNDEGAKSRWSSGKAIVYAKREVHLSEEFVLELQRQSKSGSGGFTWLADIPHGTQTIEVGHPIATVRAGIRNQSGVLDEADMCSNLLLKLNSCADRLYRMIESRDSGASCES